ncbi:MAG: T9SS type A sorting domain-containing protein [Bacteroidales bacterium]|nr:T9SS type A sorting domain-containing protein [Bacteroidales bacterium]MDR2980552.1 T9SS type A sorting domain-containing protein [Bacteroidales bacterium]
MDIGHLASGVYILKIVDGGQVWHEKIVLQK